MKKLNIPTNIIGQIAKKGCGIAIGLLALSLPYVTRENITTVKYYVGEAAYSDAVCAVMNSSMLSSYKTQAMDLIKKDGDSEYYKTVIAVVYSDMLSSYKIETLKKLTEK